MKYIFAAACVAAFGIAIFAANVFNYGSVEFAWLKWLAVSGWVMYALSCLSRALGAVADEMRKP